MIDTSSPLKQASQLLIQELLKDTAKSRWGPHLPQKITQSTDVISYRAVARAISKNEYLTYGVEYEANRYKDRVRRALTGQGMTQDTLRLFSDTFLFSEEVITQISDLLTSARPEAPTKSQYSTRLRYDITSSFYDLFVDANLKPYKVVCTLVIRSKQHELDGVWAPQSEDTPKVELVTGGTSVFDEERQMNHFLFDYPLAELESTEICYVMHIDRESEQRGIFALRYLLEREKSFFRVNFDNPETAPSALEIIRQGNEGTPNAGVETSTTISVHHGHASIYFPFLNRERIIFALSE